MTASGSDRGARTAIASGSNRGAKTAIISAKVAIECSSRQPGVKAGEPATSRTSAEPDKRADLPEVLLRVEAEVKTTMQLSPRQPKCELFEVMNLLNISLWYAPQTGSRTPPCATRTETTVVAQIHTDDFDDFFMSIPKDDFSD